jgi:pantoate--beta-alanine ligase
MFARTSVKVLTTASDIQLQVLNAANDQKIVGFVPTMGALHRGHLSLIERARAECDFIVASIFVNPTQFNDSGDFDRYPRHLTADIDLLNDAGCDVVFTPTHQEIYPTPDNTPYDFGEIEKRFEGEFRPGHFRGVAMVVRRFFEIVKPHKAYFGLKDFQQVMVIQSLVKQFNLGVEVVAVPTTREPDGLAMSSRNELLTDAHRRAAPEIYRILKACKQQIAENSIDEISNWVGTELSKRDTLKLEYFCIADAATLKPLENKNSTKHAVALIAVKAGDVRLIDNLQLF